MGFDSFRLVPWFGTGASCWFRVAFLQSSIDSWLLKLGVFLEDHPRNLDMWFIKHGDRLLFPKDRVVGSLPNGQSWMWNPDHSRSLG